MGLSNLFSGNRYVTIAIPLAIIFAVLVWFVMSKTKLGYELKATGFNKNAAKYAGMKEKKNIILTMFISGCLAGLGGIAYITAGVSEWKFENGVAGFGFLALAVMIFGQWKPVNIALAALLFGLLRALSNVYTGFHGLVALGLPSTLYNMLPYIISLLVLAIASTNSRAPKAEGIPYDKGQR